MSDSFLPKGYEVLVSGSDYMKFQDGDNVFRVLSSAITGFEYWTTDNKPVRSKEAFVETPGIKAGKDGKPQKAKHFWAFVVWNYGTKKIEILQVTQSSIQTAIANLVADPEWGDPKKYDIKVTRTGAELTTEYAVMPKPSKELTPAIAKEYAEKKINLEAIYSGENPFDNF
jgi:hypothetical protein